jgi:hypothetical protein
MTSSSSAKFVPKSKRDNISSEWVLLGRRSFHGLRRLPSLRSIGDQPDRCECRRWSVITLQHLRFANASAKTASCLVAIMDRRGISILLILSWMKRFLRGNTRSKWYCLNKFININEHKSPTARSSYLWNSESCLHKTHIDRTSQHTRFTINRFMFLMKKSFIDNCKASNFARGSFSSKSRGKPSRDGVIRGAKVKVPVNLSH